MGLDTVELIMAAEEYFEIDIIAEEAEQIETVGDFHQCILKKLTTKKHFKANAPYLSPPEVFELLKNLIHKNMGVPLKKITPEAKITRDLGID